MQIQDSTIVITGASRGLGFAIADLLARKGVNLVLVARDGAALRQAADRLQEHTQVLAVTADVSQDAERIARDTLQKFGTVDVLINNASELGPSPMPSLEELEWQELERIVRVNAIAPLHLSQLLLPALTKRGGMIINISSDAGVNAYPGWGGYGASKAALEHLSRTLAVELQNSGVRVLVVDPGDMNTRMHELAEPGVDLSALPTPDLVAPAIIRLIEDRVTLSGRYQAQALAHVG